MKPSPLLNVTGKRSAYALALAFFLCLFFAPPAMATKKMKTTVAKDDQKPAQFPGGEMAWKKYLERNLDPTLVSKNGGPAGTYTVVVSFVVDKAGMISEITAENDPGYGTKEAALNLIKKGPKWVPAEKDGQKVIYRHKQSIEFVVK